MLEQQQQQKKHLTYAEWIILTFHTTAHKYNECRKFVLSVRILKNTNIISVKNLFVDIEQIKRTNIHTHTKIKLWMEVTITKIYRVDRSVVIHLKSEFATKKKTNSSKNSIPIFFSIESQFHFCISSKVWNHHKIIKIISKVITSWSLSIRCHLHVCL